MDWLDRLVKGAVISLTAAASLCLLFLMCIIVADIVLRAIDPNLRIFGMLDYVEFSLDWMVFLSIPLALFSNMIITVDLIDTWDRHKYFHLFGTMATFLVLAVLFSQVLRPALDTLEFGEETLDLGIPKFYYWLAIWIGLGLAAVATTVHAVQVIRKRL